MIIMGILITISCMRVCVLTGMGILNEVVMLNMEGVVWYRGTFHQFGMGHFCSINFVLGWGF